MRAGSRGSVSARAPFPTTSSRSRGSLVPLLQRGGRFRERYDTTTLRARFGLGMFGESLLARRRRRTEERPSSCDRERSMTDRRKHIHLAVHFPGVNNTTVWSDPRSGSHIEFSSFVRLAQTAERGEVRFLLPRRGSSSS